MNLGIINKEIIFKTMRLSETSEVANDTENWSEDQALCMLIFKGLRVEETSGKKIHGAASSAGGDPRDSGTGGQVERVF